MTTSLVSRTIQSPVGISDFVLGDVLLFRSPNLISEAVRRIDGAHYDHAAVVVGLDGAEVRVVDLGFRGAMCYRLEQYREVPSKVLVRRHVVGSGGELVAQRAIKFVATHPHYAWDRLIDIIALSVVRYAEDIVEHTVAERMFFQRYMTGLFASARGALAIAGTGVCVDLVNFAYDCDVTRHGVASSLSLTFRNEVPLRWSVWKPAAEVLVGALGADALVEARAFFAEASSLGAVGPSVDETVAAMATFFLDRSLQLRTIVTPRDLALTRSLRDVGQVDLGAFVWRHADTADNV